jgi:hypothetical protein
MLKFIKKTFNIFALLFVLQAILLFVIIKYYHNYSSYYYSTFFFSYNKKHFDTYAISTIHKKFESNYTIHLLPEKESISLERWFNPNKNINKSFIENPEKFRKEFEYYLGKNVDINDKYFLIYFIVEKDLTNLKKSTDNFFNNLRESNNLANQECHLKLVLAKAEIISSLSASNKYSPLEMTPTMRNNVIQAVIDLIFNIALDRSIVLDRLKNNLNPYSAEEINKFCDKEPFNKRIIKTKDDANIYKIHIFNLNNLYLLSLALLFIINFFLKKIINEFFKKS